MENLFEDREQEKTYTKDYIENMYTFYGYGMRVVIHKETSKLLGFVYKQTRKIEEEIYEEYEGPLCEVD